MTYRVRITTGARLHFGLLDIAAPFGGCGVMIDTPKTIVRASEASEFSLTPSSLDHAERAGDQRRRAFTIAQRIADAMGSPESLPPVHVEVLDAAPSHTGLGSGTQLSLAIAEAILRVSPATRSPKLDVDLTDLPPPEGEIWLRAADRGKRSAVGTHGYLSGGFIAEGLTPTCEHHLLNHLDVRLEMPPAWRVTILLPTGHQDDLSTVSGDQEQAKFDALAAIAAERRRSLANLLTDQLMPAIREADFAAFCTATTRYNQRSGELFSPVQGGAYNGPATTRLIARLQASGFTGVGQSSWGPGVFVWHPDETSATEFQEHWNSPELSVTIARPQWVGRTTEVSG